MKKLSLWLICFISAAFIRKILLLVLTIIGGTNFLFAQCSSVPVVEAVRNGNFELGYLPGPNITGPAVSGTKHTSIAGGSFDFSSSLNYGGYWNGNSAVCQYSLADGYGVGRVENPVCLNGASGIVYGQYANSINYKDHTTGTNKGFALFLDFNTSSNGAYKKAWAQTVDIFASQKYYFSAWFTQYGSNFVSPLRFRVEALNASGTVIDNMVVGTGTSTQAWIYNQFWGTYNTPASAVKCNLYIETIATGQVQAEDFIIDDISFINSCQNIAGNIKPVFSSDTVNICASQTGTLSLNATYTGDINTQNNTYTWYKGAGSSQTIVTGSTLSLDVSSPDTYRLCAQDPENGCAASASIVIIKSITVFLPQAVLCSPATAVLSPIVKPVGSYTKTYAWTGNGTGSNPTYTATQAGAYYVTITNPNIAGCTGNTAAIVTSILPNAPTNLEYCQNGSVMTTLAVGDGKKYYWYRNVAKIDLTGTVANNGTVSTSWTPPAGTIGDQTVYLVSNETAPLAGSPLQSAAFSYSLPTTGTLNLVVSQTIVLSSVTIRVPPFSPSAATINLAGTAFNIRSIPNANTSQDMVVSLNWILAPGNYTLKLNSQYEAYIVPSISTTTINGFVSVSGTDVPFKNLVIQKTSACDPVPVIIKAKNCTITGIETENSDKTGISVYPNPTTDAVQIKTAVNQVSQVTISDLTGKQVYANDIESNVSTINLSHLPKGIYIINIKNEQFHKTEKLIIQ